MTVFPAKDLNQHLGPLRALARDLLGDGLADDAVQETLLSAWQRPPAAPTALPVWLRAVLGRCAIDLRRSEHRRRVREQLAAKPEAMPAVDLAERLELQQDIVRAVRALGEPYRTAVWLRYYEGLSPTEIAGRLGESVKTVKTRLWRALKLLRQGLEGRYGRPAWMPLLGPLARGGNPNALGTALTSGGMLMQGKKLAAVAVILVVALSSSWLLLQTDEDESRGMRPTAPAAVADLSEPTANSADPPPLRQGLASTPRATEVEPYGALAVQVRWHDGTPAPGVLISFRAEGETQLDRSETRFVADAQGIARAERLHSGVVALASDRGGQAKAEVLAGRENTAEFVLPRGLDVDGLVVDGLDRPVEGASVLLASGEGGWLGSALVATSNADGQFQIRAANPQWSLGATADGFAPSDLVDLDQLERAADAARVEVRLRLALGGVTLAGRVVDEQGEGIAGALVVVGRGGKGAIDPAGRSREDWDGVTTTTADDGSFTCQGLEPGHLPLAVRADGYAVHQDELVGVEGDTKVITVTLLRGVGVQGTVRDDNGEVVPDALVRAGARALENWQLAFPPGDGDTVFPWPATRSDADGHFELSCIPPGEIHLLAGVWEKRALQLRSYYQETLQGSSGDVLTWDPVLQAPRTIRIRVVDADGETYGPGVHVSVIAEQPAPGAPGGTALPQLEPWGTYVFINADYVPYTVYTRVDRDGVVTPWVYQTGVWPGGPEVVLQLPPVPLTPEPGSISGRVVDSGHRIADRALEVKLLSRRERRGLAVEGTRFHGTEIPPGRYYVQVLAGRDRVLVSPWFELQPAQRLDLGDLETAPGGDVRVVVRTPDGADPVKLSAKLGDNYDYRMMRWDGEQLVADSVTPGLHPFSLRSADWHVPPFDIDVVAGGETEITIDVAPGVRRQIMVLFPLPDRWQRGTLTIRDADGAAVYECGEVTAAVGFNPRFWVPTLPLGQYTLEAVIDGEERTWPLDFRDPAIGEQAVRISMR